MRKIRWLLVAKDRDPALAALLHTKNIDAQLERDNHDGLLLGAHWEDDADCRAQVRLALAQGLPIMCLGLLHDVDGRLQDAIPLNSDAKALYEFAYRGNS